MFMWKSCKGLSGIQIKEIMKLHQILVIMLFGFGVLNGCKETEKPKQEAETAKTNILFIFADDWGWGDLSAHGHPYAEAGGWRRQAPGGGAGKVPAEALTWLDLGLS